MPKKGEKMTPEQITARAEARARNRANGVNARGERLKAAKAEVKRVTEGAGLKDFVKAMGGAKKMKSTKKAKKGKLIPLDSIPDDKPQKRRVKKVKSVRNKVIPAGWEDVMTREKAALEIVKLAMFLAQEGK